MRLIRQTRTRILLATLIAVASCAGAARAAGIGVVLAPADERVVEQEALFAEDLIAALVAEGRQAAFLHEASPLVTSAGISFPSVGATDDWTPLASVLSSIAARLRLDYLLLVALRQEDVRMTASGMLVVRGGESADLRTSPADGRQAAAAQMARQAVSAMQRLPEPGDAADDAMPLAPVETPVGEGETQAPTEAEQPAIEEQPSPQQQPTVEEQPAPEDQPLVIADEPQTRPDPATETDATARPAPIDDALAEAEAAYDDGRLEDAAALLSASLREHGASGRAYYLRARLALARQDRDAAIGDLKRAVAIDPSLVNAEVWLARLLVEQGLWQAAQQYYQRAVETDPTHVEALLGLARLYRDHGHRRRAIKLLTEADDLGQTAPSLLMLLAELHGDEGNVELAERYFARAAAAASGDQKAVAWERLGDLYVSLHRHREALTCYVKAAELNPSRASMVERRYSEVMTAADGAVHEALTATWSAFEDFAHDGIGEREIIYRRLSEMHAQLAEALRFAESINPPGDLSERHVNRQFAYSLAVEASVLAMSWLDLGDDSMLERAEEVRADAVTQFGRLREAPRG